MKSTLEKKVTEDSKAKYLKALQSIKDTAPECKKKEVEDMIKLVEKLHVSKGEEPAEEDFDARLEALK